MNLAYFDQFPDVDPTKINLDEKVGEGAGHIVHPYGSEQVIKVVRWHKRGGDLNASTAQRNADLIENYFPRALLPTQIIPGRKTSIRGYEPYVVIQQRAEEGSTNPSPIDISKDPRVRELITEMIHQNRKLISNRGLSFDFMGGEGVRKLDEDGEDATPPTLSNILLQPGDNTPRIIDSELMPLSLRTANPIAFLGRLGYIRSFHAQNKRIPKHFALPPLLMPPEEMRAKRQLQECLERPPRYEFVHKRRLALTAGIGSLEYVMDNKDKAQLAEWKIAVEQSIPEIQKALANPEDPNHQTVKQALGEHPSDLDITLFAIAKFVRTQKNSWQGNMSAFWKMYMKGGKQHIQNFGKKGTKHVDTCEDAAVVANLLARSFGIDGEIKRSPIWAFWDIAHIFWQKKYVGEGKRTKEPIKEPIIDVFNKEKPYGFIRDPKEPYVRPIKHQTA